MKTLGPKLGKTFQVLFTVFKGKITDEKVKEKFANHKRPENCKFTVPRVNSEIWDILEHSSKSADLRAQTIQKTLLKAVYALTNVTDRCLTSKDSVAKTLVKDLMDAIGFVLKAHSHSDICVDRRTKIVLAPQVNRKYRKLSADIPVTDKLFGDDLKTVCATIDSTSKLRQNFTQSARGRKFFPRPKKLGHPVLPTRLGQRQVQPTEARHEAIRKAGAATSTLRVRGGIKNKSSSSAQ